VAPRPVSALRNPARVLSVGADAVAAMICASGPLRRHRTQDRKVPDRMPGKLIFYISTTGSAAMPTPSAQDSEAQGRVFAHIPAGAGTRCIPLSGPRLEVAGRRRLDVFCAGQRQFP
jgi:hypothetical protein